MKTMWFKKPAAKNNYIPMDLDSCIDLITLMINFTSDQKIKVIDESGEIKAYGTRVQNEFWEEIVKLNRNDYHANSLGSFIDENGNSYIKIGVHKQENKKEHWKK